MTSDQTLTDEQQAVVNHPSGEHALVLAVAGSGKTTTLVHRLNHLVRERRVPAERILVLMFNALARKQFKEKAEREGLPSSCVQRVHTFHSFAYTVIRNAGRLPPQQDIWIEDRVELQRRCVHTAIRELEKLRNIGVGEIDPEEALGAIGLWKGSLVPPERAGYRGHPSMPDVYRAYERLRAERKGLTFDDFMPLALEVLADPGVGAAPMYRYSHVIVDEYQDVNYGQQRLVEAVAGADAEVMVVGDDDQTIFEWLGARPDYIRRLFPERFPGRATQKYTLTRSFRFGPLIAQCADNVIAQNGGRHEKAVIAHRVHQKSQVLLRETHSQQSSDVDGEMGREILQLREEYRAKGITDLRERIVVLGRTFSQLAGLEGEFLRREIPYCVVGKAPFLERREVVALMDYVRVARHLTAPLDQRLSEALAGIINMPNRRIATSDIRQAIASGLQKRATPYAVLEALASDRQSNLARDQRDRVLQLGQRLERLGELVSRGDMMADGVLEWLMNAVDYRQHFRDYFGKGEDSLERVATLDALLSFAKRSTMDIYKFADLVDGVDPTRGAPREELVVFTSVQRTKGLEYDHVFIPNCVEGMMPVPGGVEVLTYDTDNTDAQPPASSALDNERRLFYVAITRAKKQVCIGTAEAPKQGVQLNSNVAAPSRFLEEMRLGATAVIADGLTTCIDQETVTQFVSRACEAYLQDRTLGAALRNVAERYLPDLAYPRAADHVRKMLRESPPSEFTYAQIYASVGEVKPARQAAAEQHLPPLIPTVTPEDLDVVYR